MSQFKVSPTLETFTAGKLKSVLVGQPEDLTGLCWVLNLKEPAELVSELRRLVANWQNSGPNLAQLLRDDPVLAERAKHGRTLLIPTNVGKGHLLWLSNPPRFNPISWKDTALTHFMGLIVNPRWDKLGGPCHRCDKYYVKQTSRQKKYCSRRCGSTSTAVDTARKRRAEELANKLLLAQSAANRWTTIRTRRPWKEWVSAKTGITAKWLTRAVNRGDLQTPRKRQNRSVWRSQ
jgi:hypothetical protein